MEYSKYDKYGNEPVDGFIIQAPVSDREALVYALSKKDVENLVTKTEAMIDAGQKDEVVPKSSLPPGFPFECPITAYRLHSLCAPG